MWFYLVSTASCIYEIGAPQIPELTIKFIADNKPRTFQIVAKNISEENKYIQKVMLDGKALNTPFITHQQIINGHKLIFEMGAKPNYNWK